MSDTEESQELKESMAEAWAWNFPYGDISVLTMGTFHQIISDSFFGAREDFTCSEKTMEPQEDKAA